MTNLEFFLWLTIIILITWLWCIIREYKYYKKQCEVMEELVDRYRAVDNLKEYYEELVKENEV